MHLRFPRRCNKLLLIQPRVVVSSLPLWWESLPLSIPRLVFVAALRSRFFSVLSTLLTSRFLCNRPRLYFPRRLPGWWVQARGLKGESRSPGMLSTYLGGCLSRLPQNRLLLSPDSRRLNRARPSFLLFRLPPLHRALIVTELFVRFCQQLTQSFSGAEREEVGDDGDGDGIGTRETWQWVDDSGCNSARPEWCWNKSRHSTILGTMVA